LEKAFRFLQDSPAKKIYITTTIMTQTMPLLKEVGTKLGLTTGKTGSMRNVAEYVNQHRGELIRKEEILSDLNLQDKEKPAIENCFHRGYILRGQNLGNDYYFIPDISEAALIDLRNEFQQLETFPVKKQQLIQNLIGNIASSSTPRSNIPKDNASPQTPPSEEEASKESAARKMFLQKELEQLEKDSKALDLMRQEIQEKQIKIDAQKKYLAEYEQMFL
jgi:hypothetical protein